MLTYNPGHFVDLAKTPFGIAAWEALNGHDEKLMMKTATYLGKPAVEPLSPVLEAKFGDQAFSDRAKQMLGHMTRQIMEAEGYKLDRTGVRITTEGNRFSTGARYKA